jgi:hypothetical protein
MLTVYFQEIPVTSCRRHAGNSPCVRISHKSVSVTRQLSVSRSCCKCVVDSCSRFSVLIDFRKKMRLM